MSKVYSCPRCGFALSTATVEELPKPGEIHQCCGCSCNVCENGHTIGVHTKACSERFWQEMEQDMELEGGA